MTRDPLELAERLERYPRLSDDSFRAAYTHGDMRETLAEAAACIREMHRLLAAHTSWEPGVGMKETRRPTHGTCCTCQKCGQYHDDCVCEHNEIEAALRGAAGVAE